jgi:hypothetical protein
VQLRGGGNRQSNTQEHGKEVENLRKKTNLVMVYSGAVQTAEGISYIIVGLSMVKKLYRYPYPMVLACMEPGEEAEFHCEHLDPRRAMILSTRYDTS